MIGLIPLLLVPVAVILVMRHFGQMHHTVTRTEAAALLLAMSILLAVGFALARQAAMLDFETHSGRITEKRHGTQSCCHCHEVCTSRNSEGHCTSHHTVCQHTFDYWWSLALSTGDVISVESCSSSSRAPALWVNASVGEAAVAQHAYTNYLWADPESVYLRPASAAQVMAVPAYPDVYGLYRMQRAFSVGTTMMDFRAVDAGLMELNADLGDRDKVNVIVIATNQPRTFTGAVEHAWLYGKMNDAVVVLGTTDGRHVAWADLVSTPGSNNVLRVAVQRELVGLDLAHTESVLARMRDLVDTHWRWYGLRKFEYLAAHATPGPVATALLYILAVVLSVGGVIFADKHSFFGDEPRSWRS